MSKEENLSFAVLFGEFIREGRVKQKLSQADLAKKLGMTQSYLSRIEQGARSIDFELAICICSILNLDLREFLKETSNK